VGLVGDGELVDEAAWDAFRDAVASFAFEALAAEIEAADGFAGFTAWAGPIATSLELESAGTVEIRAMCNYPLLWTFCHDWLESVDERAIPAGVAAVQAYATLMFTWFLAAAWDVHGGPTDQAEDDARTFMHYFVLALYGPETTFTCVSDRCDYFGGREQGWVMAALALDLSDQAAAWGAEQAPTETQINTARAKLLTAIISMINVDRGDGLSGAERNLNAAAPWDPDCVNMTADDLADFARAEASIVCDLIDGTFMCACAALSTTALRIMDETDIQLIWRFSTGLVLGISECGAGGAYPFGYLLFPQIDWTDELTIEYDSHWVGAPANVPSGPGTRQYRSCARDEALRAWLGLASAGDCP
jgi:hypothetical protein